MDLGQRIVIILFIFLAIWYLIGSIINRRLGVSVFEWLRTGLGQLGKISEARWIGSSGSGARIVVAQAGAPFQRVEVVYLMESREILPLWLFNRIRGKRDEMVIRANLRSAPLQELEAARHSSREFQRVLSNPETKSFELLPNHMGFELARRGRNDVQATEKFKELLNKHQDAITQVSLQRQAPHLILRALIPPLRSNPSGVFFEDIRQIFE
jgi:hypothetical protein